MPVLLLLGYIRIAFHENIIMSSFGSSNARSTPTPAGISLFRTCVDWYQLILAGIRLMPDDNDVFLPRPIF